MGGFAETFNDPTTFIVTARGGRGVLPIRGGSNREGYPAFSGLRYMKG